MSGLRFTSSAYQDLHAEILADSPLEACAIGFGWHDPKTETWCVDEIIHAPQSAYVHRDTVSATLQPAFLVEVANKARPKGQSVILIHSHPMAVGKPHFSAIDDGGEVELNEYFSRRVPDGKHLALVVAPEGCSARRLGSGGDVPVWTIGKDVAEISGPDGEIPEAIRHDRQVRAFGREGQGVIAGMRIGVVGAGGTGSVLIQQLAHLGVEQFLIIDPDRIEETNLNRVAGAGPADIGRPKSEVSADMARRIRPEAEVIPLIGDVVDADVADRLTAMDFIFLCTDSHASRAVVGQLAYQHLVPAIDMGVSVTVKNGAVTYISGRAQMLAPGMPCLACTCALDGEQIRREMLTPDQRALDHYIVGAQEPQPAIMSINSVVSSLAVTMFLGAVTSIPAGSRFQRYDGVRGVVRDMTATIAPNCIVCSPAGSLAKGSSWQLPVRPAKGASNA